MGEFWDTHDFTDFDSDAPDVEFEITCVIPIGTIESQMER
jgi:hypothetical protein